MVSGSDPLSLVVDDVTRWYVFLFFFFFKGCIRAAKQKCMCVCACICVCVDVCGCVCVCVWTCMCVCLCLYALGTLLLQVLQLIAHSAATWTVQSRPNFSIHRHKRKLTPSLCLASATLTQALSLKRTARLKLMAVSGHFWRFSYAVPP